MTSFSCKVVRTPFRNFRSSGSRPYSKLLGLSKPLVMTLLAMVIVQDISHWRRNSNKTSSAAIVQAYFIRGSPNNNDHYQKSLWKLGDDSFPSRQNYFRPRVNRNVKSDYISGPGNLNFETSNLEDDIFLVGKGPRGPVATLLGDDSPSSSSLISSVSKSNPGGAVSDQSQINQILTFLKTRKFKLCGTELPNVLSLVCKGVYYDGNNNDQDTARVIRRLKRNIVVEDEDDLTNNYADQSELEDPDNIIYEKKLPGAQLTNGGAAKKCCQNSCSYIDLLRFCGKRPITPNISSKAKTLRFF